MTVPEELRTCPGGTTPFLRSLSRPSPFGIGGGSKITPYTKTKNFDDGYDKCLTSISAMRAYEERSTEELRWADYQTGVLEQTGLDLVRGALSNHSRLAIGLGGRDIDSAAGFQPGMLWPLPSTLGTAHQPFPSRPICGHESPHMHTAAPTPPASVCQAWRRPSSPTGYYWATQSAPQAGGLFPPVSRPSSAGQPAAGQQQSWSSRQSPNGAEAAATPQAAPSRGPTYLTPAPSTDQRHPAGFGGLGSGQSPLRPVPVTKIGAREPQQQAAAETPALHISVAPSTVPSIVLQLQNLKIVLSLEPPASQQGHAQ